MLSAVLLLLTGAGTLFRQVRLPLIVLFTKLASPLSSLFPALNAVGASNGLVSEEQKALPLAWRGVSVPTSLLGIVLLR